MPRAGITLLIFTLLQYKFLPLSYKLKYELGFVSVQRTALPTETNSSVYQLFCLQNQTTHWTNLKIHFQEVFLKLFATSLKYHDFFKWKNSYYVMQAANFALLNTLNDLF